MKKDKKKWICAIMGLIMTASMVTGCASDHSEDRIDPEQADSTKQTESATSGLQTIEDWLNAETTPFGAYPEEVQYTLGKLIGAGMSNMPKGDTYEDNLYTRVLKEKLNIQNKDAFEELDDQYDKTVAMAAASGTLPDVFVISDQETLEMLAKQGVLEDLTDSFQNCMSDRIKDIYNSYDESIMDVVTFDGKILAIPETNITDGPNLVWLRKDWMDKLNLEDPKNMEDVEYIVRQFIKEDPGNNGEGNTIGIVCDPGLCGGCGYSSEYMLDLIFASFDSYPKQWIDEDGKIVYGSLTDETKEALQYISGLYQDGVIDHDFLMRTSANIIELVIDGKTGSFFGPWWAPNNPLMNAVEKDPEADWRPYLIATKEDGTTWYHSQNPSYKYVAVRKGYEHPEIVCKMISVLFDWMRYENTDDREAELYFQNNVDPTARPIAINVDYKDALTICYQEIQNALTDENYSENLKLLEKSYYDSCREYLDDPEQKTAENWAAYTSRISACSLLSSDRIFEKESVYFGKTETMEKRWWQLEKMEEEYFLKIITGDIPAEDFSKFSEKWKENGGSEILEEINQIIKEK